MEKVDLTKKTEDDALEIIKKMKEDSALRQKTIEVNFAGSTYKIDAIKSEKEMMASARQAALGHKSKLGSLKTNSALDCLVSQIDN